MKKILPFILLAGIGFLSYSCDNKDDVVVAPDKDTVAIAFEATPTFTKVNNNLYSSTQTFQNALVQSDVVLIYLQTGLTNNNSPIWRLLPYTFYTDLGTPVDYSYDFSKFDVVFNVNSTMDLSLNGNSQYYTNKRFRVVIVPANTASSNKNTNSSMSAPVDYSDYNSVIKYYKIDESKIKTL